MPCPRLAIWARVGRQAGGPYAVDDAAIGDVGACHAESWVSAASNGDLIGTAQPACVVRFGGPLELQGAFRTVHFDAEWARLTGLQIKFILLGFGPQALLWPLPSAARPTP